MTAETTVLTITDKKDSDAMKKDLTPAEKRKKRRKQEWLKALTNPHLLISVAVAWFITNGWSYCALGLGWFFEISWLRNIGAVYLAILWAPGTPEKLFTFGVAMVMLRVLFPKDTRTLAMLRRKRRLLLIITKMQFQHFKEKIAGRKKKKDTEQQGSAEKQDNSGSESE